MANLLLIGDPHLKKKKSFEYTPLLTALKRYILENRSKIDGVGIMGDLVDAHEVIDMTAKCDAEEMIFEISQEMKIPVIKLTGNHDRRNNAEFLNHYSAFYGLSHTPNVYLVDRPMVISIKSKSILALPYIPKNRLDEALEVSKLDLSKIRVGLSHQEYRGSVYNKKLSEDGDIWKNHDIRIYNGHIHDYGRPQPNVINIGTPHQISFAESEDKALMLVHIPEDDTEAITEERIYLDLPKKISLTLPVQEAYKWNKPGNDYYKLTITGTAAELAVFKKSEQWTKLRESGVVIKKMDHEEQHFDRYRKTEKKIYLHRLEEFVGYDKLQLEWHHRCFPEI